MLCVSFVDACTFVPHAVFGVVLSRILGKDWEFYLLYTFTRISDLC